MPDSTTEPKKSRRNSKMFQEGDDVFFKTNDEQNVLGTVGQVSKRTLIYYTCLCAWHVLT